MRVQRWLTYRYVTLRLINKTPQIHKAADLPANQTVKSASKSETLQLQSKWYLKGFTYVSVEEETAWLLVQWSSCSCSNPEHAQGSRMANCGIPLCHSCLSPLEGALVEPSQLGVGFTMATGFHSHCASRFEAQAYKQKHWSSIASTWLGDKIKMQAPNVRIRPAGQNSAQHWGHRLWSGSTHIAASCLWTPPSHAWHASYL